jgi:hypothetical protein
VAEALVMQEGLELANRMGCNAIEAESDSLETVEARKGEEVWWAESSAIFADCVDLVSLIGTVIFKHCPREANQDAHELAKFSFSNKSFCNWLDEAPSFLLNKFIDDVILVGN